MKYITIKSISDFNDLNSQFNRWFDQKYKIPNTYFQLLKKNSRELTINCQVPDVIKLFLTSSYIELGCVAFSTLFNLSLVNRRLGYLNDNSVKNK
ncbi:hypothetical protein MXB_4972 [Myxobolus squamalis]|nr:hypothetical protein MXB_4972 [Myxobolus squamalis]